MKQFSFYFRVPALRLNFSSPRLPPTYKNPSILVIQSILSEELANSVQTAEFSLCKHNEGLPCCALRKSSTNKLKVEVSEEQSEYGRADLCYSHNTESIEAMATCTPPKDVIHPSLLHRPSKAGAPFPVQLIRDLAPWFNQSMETAHRPRVNGILKMESVALAESLQQTEMSLQNKSLHSRGVWTNAEAKRVGNVGQCASSAETGLASGTLEVGETENANGTQSELSAISRSGGVEEDCKRFLVGKVSDRVSAYATVLNSGLRTEDMLQRRKTPFLREKNPKNEVARFNPAKLDNLEGGESPKDQSCVIMLKNRSTVECPYNDFECKRVEEISSGSYVSDAFSSAAIMDQKASAGKDNNISGFKKVRFHL
eukprot:Gb_31401 [translate_table: standard]